VVEVEADGKHREPVLHAEQRTRERRSTTDEGRASGRVVVEQVA
jgi:hypothetical protein